jgi:peptide/nickel transport system substrate-binding protein
LPPDPTTFILTLKAPNSAFLLTQTIAAVFAISSPKALADGNASASDFKDNKYAQGGPPAMVGTGPFMFKEWVPGDHVTLVKNPNYWNAAAGGPYLDGITFKVIADSTATLNALQSGDIDFSQILSPVDGTTAATDPNLQAIDRGGSCNAFILAMNQAHKPFDNPKIREAVAYAVNKQALIDAFYSGQAALPITWAPPNTANAKDENLPTYDPEKAKALIKESGVTDLSFDFWYPSDVSRPYMPDPKGEFEAMLRDLEAVGFKPNPKTSTWRPDYLASENSGKYPMWLIGWTCDWQGIDNFLNAAWFGYRTTGGKYGPNPEFNYKNDAMNQGILDALAAADDSTAQAAWAKVQDMLRADMPAVPLLSSKPPAAAQTYVKGFVPAGNLTESFGNVWLDK